MRPCSQILDLPDKKLTIHKRSSLFLPTIRDEEKSFIALTPGGTKCGMWNCHKYYKTFLAVIYNLQTLYWVTPTLSCHPDLLAKTAMVESGNPY